MAKKNNTLERSKWIFLGFIFALIIFSGIFLAKAFNDEPANYPTTPDGVVTKFYSWYIDCLNGGGNCEINTSHYLDKGFSRKFDARSLNVVCSKDPIESFEIDEIKTDGDNSTNHIHAMTSLSTVAHIRVTLHKIRSIWKIVDIKCGHE